MPSCDQRLARQDQFLGESIQFDEIHGGLFEQRIPGPESLGIAHQQREVAREGLGQEQVQKAPSPLGRSLHQGQVFGAENHRSQDAEIIGQFSDGPFIEREFAFLGRPVGLDLADPLALHRASDKVALGPLPDHLRSAAAAERSQGRQQVDGFQDVGLALGIVAQEDVTAGPELGIQPDVIPEVAQFESGQMHVTRSVGVGWSECPSRNAAVGGSTQVWGVRCCTAVCTARWRARARTCRGQSEGASRV